MLVSIRDGFLRNLIAAVAKRSQSDTFTRVRFRLMLFEVFGEEHLPKKYILDIVKGRPFTYEHFAFRKIFNPIKWVEFILYYIFEVIIFVVETILQMLSFLLWLPGAFFRLFLKGKDANTDHIVVKGVDALFIQLPLGLVRVMLGLVREAFILLLNCLTSPIATVVPALKTFFVEKSEWQKVLFVLLAVTLWTACFAGIIFAGLAVLPAALAPLAIIIHPITLVFASAIHGLSLIGLSVPIAKLVLAVYASAFSIRFSHDLCSGAIMRFLRWAKNCFLYAKDELGNNFLYGKEKEVLKKNEHYKGSLNSSQSSDDSDDDVNHAQKYKLKKNMKENVLGHLLQGTSTKAPVVDPDHRSMFDLNNTEKQTSGLDKVLWGCAKFFFGWEPHEEEIVSVSSANASRGDDDAVQVQAVQPE